MKISHLGQKVSTGLLTASAFLASAGTAFAQGDQIANVGRIGIFQGDLRTLIGNIVNVGLALVGIIAVLYLIYGGVIYITAGGDAEKAGKGRVAITNAIIGIIIIMASLVLYNAVNGASSGQLR